MSLRTAQIFGLFLLFLGLLGAAPLAAQTTVSIPNGGTFTGESHNAGPIYRSSASSGYDASRYAYVYTAAELGIPSGSSITSLAWYKGNNTETVGNGQLKIYLKNSAVTNYTANTAWTTLISGLTPSMDASVAVPATIGYIPYTLTTPFVYTGGGLEIMVEWDISAVAGNPTTGAFNWRYNLVTDRNMGRVNTTLTAMAAQDLSITNNGIASLNDFRPWIQIAYSAPIALNPGLGAFTSPASPLCTGPTNITLPLNNLGTNALTNATIDWTVNGVAQTPYSFSGNLAGNGGTTSITLGTINVLANTLYSISATISDANNGGTDGDLTNNSRSLTNLQNGLSGAYTINAAQATGGNNFQSFTDMASALNNRGLCGPTTVSVTVGSGPYTNQQISLGQLIGSSSVNTLTIDGNGETFSFNSTNTNVRYGIQLNGTDFVTIREMNIVGTGTTGTDFNWGIHLTASANNNVITDNTIQLSTASTVITANVCGIVASGSNTGATTAGDPTNNTRIARNTITGGYYSVILVGNGTTSQSLNNEISNNTLNDYYFCGIYLGGQNNVQVFDNVIARPTRSNNPATVYGTYALSGIIGSEFYRNAIHSPFSGAPTSASAYYGMYFSGSDAAVGNENILFNNILYNFNGLGNQYGIANFGSDYMRIYHNSIDMAGTNPSATGFTYGIYHSTAAIGIDIRNNMVSVTRAGSGLNVAIYFNAFSTITSNYNNLFASGTSAHVGNFIGTTYTTLANWQTVNASAYDANSTSVTPTYVNAASGNLTPSNSSVNNTGTPLAAVATDYLGTARDAATPDVGAYEFTPMGLDAGVAWVSPTVPMAAGSQTITVSISNTQSTPITVVELNYSDGALVNEAQTFGSLNLQPGQSTNLSFTTAYSLSGSASITVTITSVNGVADDNAANNTVVQGLCPALSGIYTINNLVATGGTNFTSFNDAVNALSSCGMAGPVVFNVNASSGPYTEQVVFPATIVNLGTYSLRINGNGRTLRATPNTSARHVVWLNGADSVTISNLNIVGLDPTFGYGIRLSNQANNNTISNCTVDMSAITSTAAANSAGICASASATAPTGTGNNASNTLISNNNILGGASGGPYYGIALCGNSPGADCNDNIIQNNTIRDFLNNGIRLINTLRTVVDNNQLSRPNITIASAVDAINLTGTGNPGTVIKNNRIFNIYGGNTAHTNIAYGLDIVCDGTVSQPIRLFNNLVVLGDNSGGTYLANLSSADYVDCVFNTFVSDYSAATAGLTRGVNVSGACSNLNISNNVVSITRGGTGAKHAIYYGAAPTSSTANYNDYYVSAPAGTNFIGFLNTDQATLVNWQASSGQDANSVSADPQFTSPASNDYTPVNIALNNIATPIAYVTTDINAAVRGASPDLGAFEFTPPSDDAGVQSFTFNACPGSQTISVVVRNFGLVPLTSVVVTATLNGTALPNSGNTFTVNIPTAGTQSVSLGSVTLSDGVSYTLVASSSLPNGNSDANAANDGANQTFVTAMSGTYTINSALPTAGSNFQTFQAAAAALANTGVCGPVTINVVSGSGPYLEQVNFGAITGTSATNTVTINGNGQTLQFAPDGTNRHILRLSGADYMMFNNLVVRGTAADYGYGIHLYNQSDYNTFSNCTVDLGAITNTLAAQSAGIVASNSTLTTTTAGNNANNCVITNCQILGSASGGPYYGIIFNGNTGGLDCNNNRFTDNTVTNFYNNGIRLINSSGSVITGNALSRPDITAVGATDGIYLSGTSHADAVIANNRIFNLYGGSTASTSASNGINIASDGLVGQPIKVYNNVVQIGNNSGTAYPLNISGTDYLEAYFNTLVVDNAASTAGTVRGIFVQGTTTNLNISNNVVSITRGGTGTKHCIYIGATPSAWTANRNVYHLAAPAGSNHIGFFGANRTALADWQTASGQDANTLSADPLFANAAAGNLAPTAMAINNTASAVAYVTTDFNGVARAASPDPGAYEFTPPADDAGVQSFSFTNCAGSQTISAVVRNYGLTTLTSIVVTATLNGTALPNSGNTFTVNIASGSTQSVNLGSVTLSNGVSYTLSAETGSPNANPDANAANNAASQTFTTAWSGTLTINSAQATSGSNFQTFGAAAAALAADGVCGPVTINVAAGSGPYTEQVDFAAITGTSAANTVTVNGNGETLQFAPDATNRHILRLSGADYMTFNNLVVRGTSADYGYGIHLYNQSDNNTFSNCTVDLGAITNTLPAQSAGIVASNSTTATTTAGNNANNCTVSNCQILGSASGGPYYGIVFCGNTGGLDCAGNQFTGNTLTNFYNNGIRLINTSGSVVTGNALSRPDITAAGNTEGIYLTGTSHANAVIADNRISNLYGAAPNSTGTSNGIDIASDGVSGQPIKVYNNVVQIGNNNGTAYPLNLNGADFVEAVFNTLVVDNAASTAGTVRGIFVQGATSNLTVSNNLVSITRGGTGAKHCIYVDAAPSSWTANRNVYHLAAPAGSNHIGFFGANRTALADWQTASGQDANAQAADPLFVDATVGNFAPTQLSINNMATTVAYVATDFNGLVRGGSPDPGAYEFTPAPCQNPPTAGTASSDKTAVCLNETFNLSISGYTFGAGQTYQWQSSTDGNSWSNIALATAATFSTTLSTSTYYRCLLTCGASAASTPALVELNPFYVCYCTAVHASACSSNHITNVSVQGTAINNSSACGNANAQAFTIYPAGPSTTATLGLGQTYTLSVSVFNATLNQTISVWIDYNRNGVFEGSEWYQVSANAPNGVPQTLAVTIPGSAQFGPTGMRIRSRPVGSPNGASDACTSFGGGETEDYMVTIACSSVTGKVYVNDNATGGNNGTSWDNAYNDIYVALANAAPGQTVWVAQGSYLPTNAALRTATINLRPGVSLMGGFPDGVCPVPADRNWAVYTTTISGDIGAAANNTDNSYRVMTAVNVGSGVTVDGFTFRDAAGNAFGGGLYVAAIGAGSTSSPSFVNCTFTGNTTTQFGGGAGVFASNGGNASPSFTNCVFTNNSADAFGGAVGVQSQSGSMVSVSMDNCTFTGNSSPRRGGAISNGAITGAASQVSISDSEFDGNAGPLGGGAIYNYARSGASATLILSQDTLDGNTANSGAALYNHSQGGNATCSMEECVVSNNTTTVNGGAITTYADMPGSNNSLSILKTTFTGNSSLTGGVLFVAGTRATQSSLSISRSWFADNTATEGAVIAANYVGIGATAAFTVTNSVFYRNIASGRSAILLGATSQAASCTGVFESNTMHGNTSKIGTLAYLRSSSSTNTVTFRNGIASQSTQLTPLANPFVAQSPGSQLTVEFSLLDSACALETTVLTGATVNCGSGNLAGSPSFVDAANGNFRLQAGSPAIDAANAAGAPAVDYLGNNRPVGAGVDMGAFEFGGAIPRLANSAAASFFAELSPNPSVGPFRLDFAAPANGTLEVFDLQGARLFSQGLFEARRADFDLSAFPAGVYLLRVTAGEEVHTFRALVQKP